ncbi:MAG: ATP-binding cassette domain-containing protein [Alkalispirochaetaceae bacterium]
MPGNEPIRFEGVSFSYPGEEGSGPTEVFRGLSVVVDSGVTTLVGPNGVGKSTFMLLAGGRLMPEEGRVLLLEEDTRQFHSETPSPLIEERRNQVASFIYQNMEFESEESVGELIEYVQEAGSLAGDQVIRSDVVEALELGPSLSRRTGQLSKGELQRTIIAFSLLYGSPVILMDEPVFALEEPQKDRVFAFLMEHARQRELTVLYSAHNIDLSAKYSDQTLLFSRGSTVAYGPTSEIFTRQRLEEAFQAPYDTLYQRQLLYRDVLNRVGRKQQDE